jgi:hypothetical protein
MRGKMLFRFWPCFCFHLPFRDGCRASHTQRYGNRRGSKQDNGSHASHWHGVAVIDHGKTGYANAYGLRNAKGDPLITDTVLYGASLSAAI